MRVLCGFRLCRTRTLWWRSNPAWRQTCCLLCRASRAKFRASTPSTTTGTQHLGQTVRVVYNNEKRSQTGVFAGVRGWRAWLQLRPVSVCRVFRLSLISCGGNTPPTLEERSCLDFLSRVRPNNWLASLPLSSVSPSVLISPLFPAEYPELQRIKRELSLLSKLYTLYKSVIDSVAGYYDILWVDLNIEKINTELQDFQNRYSRRSLVI